MNSNLLGNTIQLITLVSVVGGIGLVIWELRQQREFAEAQQVFNISTLHRSSLQTLMGEEVSASLEKACDNPDSLTTKDMHVLINYYREMVGRIRTNYQVSQVTSMTTFDWRSAAQGNFPTVFATDYGRWLWKQGSLYAEPEIRVIGDEIFERLSSSRPSCSSFFDGYRNRNS